MKKLFCLLVVSGLATTSNAQITITQVDMPSVGSVVVQAFDSTSFLNAGSGGVNQTWNFSSLQNHGEDTITFTNPSWTPYGSFFSGSNLAILTADQYDTSCTYLTVNSTGLSFDGQMSSFNQGGAVQFIPGVKFIGLPATYQSSYNGSSSFDFSAAIDSMGDSVRFKEIYNYDSEIDGWGSVTTPLGSFNSLRQHFSIDRIDSSWAYTSFTGWQFYGVDTNSSDEYRWWANNVKFPIVEMTIDGNGNLDGEIAWLKVQPTQSGIYETSSMADVSLFPNPAANEINIISTVSKANSVIILDGIGRQMNKISLENLSLKINTADYSNGIYLYQISDKDGIILDKGRFVVNK